MIARERERAEILRRSMAAEAGKDHYDVSTPFFHSSRFIFLTSEEKRGKSLGTTNGEGRDGGSKKR